MRKEIMARIINFSTPCYVYDQAKIVDNIRVLKSHFKRSPVEIYYAVKANAALAVLRLIERQGLGAEAVSPGEIFLARKAGFAAGNILYNNIARKDGDVLYALKNGIQYFNFESIDQAELLERQAHKAKKTIKAFVRVNPGIFPDTHPHLSTGSSRSKFGISEDQIDDVITISRRLRQVRLIGIHCHIGSQILHPAPFIRAASRVAYYVERLRKAGLSISHVNLGGGFGVPHHPDEVILKFQPIIDAYQKLAKTKRVKIFIEPGRFVVSNSGFILSRVISKKKVNRKDMLIIDAGMTENPRPAIYDAYHHIEPFIKKFEPGSRRRVAGPLCENSDEFGMYCLPDLKIGDMVMIRNCGAYTRTMASNYNGRLLPAEYIISGKKLIMIRRPQAYPDLISNEKH